MTRTLPHHPNRKPGWLSRAASRRRYLAAAGTITVAIAGLVIAQAGPAAADPVVVYVAVGSDVTQDVMNQYSIDIGGNELASYNATNPVTGATHEPITPVKPGNPPVNCSFPRPLNSTEGLNDLRTNPNCVDIVRASTGPGASAIVTGVLVYIPFAVDATTGATGPASGPGATAITTADDFTLNDLRTLYANCGTVTEGGVTYNPVSAAPGQVQINLYVPQAGSDTLSLWASLLSFSATTLPACVHDTIVAGPDANTPVQEGNGTAVDTDPNGYMPFSIQQWISQRNGHGVELRNGAVLHSMSGISPFDNGNPANGNLNPAFPTAFEVYNVVYFDRVVNTGDGKFDPALTSLLAGAGSSLCQDAFTILDYGFGTDSQCGVVSNSLRSN